MSIAKQCDICGGFYEPYNIKNNAKNTNGLAFLNIDNEMHYFAHDPIDCCPECIDVIQRYIDFRKKMMKMGKDEEE